MIHYSILFSFDIIKVQKKKITKNVLMGTFHEVLYEQNKSFIESK